MNNCLLTKLKGVVDNDNLEFFDSITFEVTSFDYGNFIQNAMNDVIFYGAADGTDLEIEILSDNATMHDWIDGSPTKRYHYSSSANYITVVFDIGTVNYDNPMKLRIYNLSKTKFKGSNIVYKNIDLNRLFSYKTSFTRLSVQNTDDTLNCDINKIPKDLIYLCLRNTTIKATTSQIAEFKNAIVYQHYDTNSLSGNIAELGNCDSISGIYTNGNSQLYGTIENLATVILNNPNADHNKSIAVAANYTNVTYNGEPFTYIGYLRFGTAMQNPTEEETSRNWQFGQ